MHVFMQEGIRNQTELAEPNRTVLISEPTGTRRGTEPNRSGPSHDAFEKRMPNRLFFCGEVGIWVALLV